MAAALLIGISQYDEASFHPLPAATADVEAVHAALRHPEIGAMRASEVTLLLNPPLQQVQTAIAALCTNRQADELVLLYFSGYGIVDDQGELYLPCRDTDSKRLERTALLVAELQSALEICRSQRQVLILDCCFSGTFTKGMVSPSDVDMIGHQLSGKRRAFLSSPWSIEYSSKHKSSNPSTYTQYLLNGLETGMADGVASRPLDGEVTVLELHDYIRKGMEEDMPALFPKLYTTGQGYEIAITRAPYVDFRREALSLATRGDISPVGQSILEQLRLRLGVPQEIASAIKKDALKPYRVQNQKRKEYESIRAEVTKREAPLSDNTQVELLRLREVYDIPEEGAPKQGVFPSVTPASPNPENQPPAENRQIPAETIPPAPSPESPTIPPRENSPAPESPPSEENTPSLENRFTRFLREKGLAPTTLEEEPSPRQEDQISRFLRERDVSPETVRLGIAGLAVLGLLASVLWVAFQPLPRSANQFVTPEEAFREGYSKSQNGDRKGAIEAYTQAIQSNPDNPNFHYNRGIEYSKQGDRKRAIEDYTEAIRLDPVFADAHFNRANAYAATGDREAARRDYEQAAKIYQGQRLFANRQEAQEAIRKLQPK